MYMEFRGSSILCLTPVFFNHYQHCETVKFTTKFLCAVFITLLQFYSLTDFANGQSSASSLQQANKSSNQASIDFNTLLFEVHLTGDIPYTGMFRVPPGTRVDELVSNAYETWRLKESQILISPSGLSDPSQQPPEDTFSDVLNSKLDLRNITIIKRDGSVHHADIIGYRLGGLLSSNPSLEQGDVINLRKLSDDPFYVSVSGAVKTPITIPVATDDTALDLLMIAGGKTSIAAQNQILIYRMKLPQSSNGQSNWTQASGEAFDLFTLTDDQLAEFELVPGDRMIIPVDHSQRTIRHVKISGEVIRPGTYPIIEGVTTLFEVMDMAGGPTENALLNAIEITRTSDPGMTFQIVEGEFQPLPDIFRVSDQFEESRLLLQNQVLMDNNVIFADLSGLFSEKQVSETNPFGSSGESFNADVPLFSEDEVHIPKNQNTIRIMGQIGVPGFYPFNPDLTYQDYIATASGLSPAADSSRIFIIKAATKNWVHAQNTTLSSGDILFVDSRPIGSYALAQDLEIRKIDLELRRETLITEKKRANLQIFVSLVNVTASVITTYLLIRR